MDAASQHQDGIHHETQSMQIPGEDDTTPVVESSQSIVMEAVKNLIHAMIKPANDDAVDWIPFSIAEKNQEAMGYNGLGPLIRSLIVGDIGSDPHLKKFFTSELKIKRGKHNQGVYYFKLSSPNEADEHVRYATRDEPGGPPYIAWFRSPDISTDRTHISDLLGKIPDALRSNRDTSSTESYEGRVCAVLRTIISKGTCVAKQESKSPSHQPTARKSATRKRPVTTESTTPDVRRLRAAGEFLLNDAKGAQTFIDLGGFLSSYHDMTEIMRTSSNVLTARRRAAKSCVRSGQLLHALKEFKQRQSPEEPSSPSLSLRTPQPRETAGSSMVISTPTHEKRTIPFDNQPFMEEMAFAMRNDAAIATRISNGTSKHEFVDPIAVSDNYILKYTLRKIIGYCESDEPHAFIDSPVTRGICSVLGINPTGIKSWDLDFVISTVTPFLNAYNIDDLCNNPEIKSKLRALKEAGSGSVREIELS